FLGCGARQIEGTIAPIGTRVVHAHDERTLVLRAPHEQRRPVGIDRARCVVGTIRMETLARRSETARIEAVLAAIIIMRSGDRLFFADKRLCLFNGLNAMAFANETIGLPRRLRL